MDFEIPIYKPSLLGNEQKYVQECLASTWISSTGSFVGRFEEAFSNWIGCKYATVVANGTTALHLALKTLRVGLGDEVIVPTFSYVAVANAVVHAQATPIFVDAERKFWQMDVKDVQRKITAKTKAIIAVHVYGHPCELSDLCILCQEHGIYLIEDCAEAIGSRYDDRHVGLFGDTSIFSFYGNKTLTTGEGGMLITDSEELLVRAKSLKNQFISPGNRYWHDGLGYNYRMTNICAAIGLAQLERVEEILRKKRDIHKYYEKALLDLPLEMHREKGNVQHSHWLCSILLQDKGKRDSLRSFLLEHRIEHRPFFYPAHSFSYFQSSSSMPVADDISSRGINLPSWPDMNDSELKTVVETIQAFFDDAG